MPVDLLRQQHQEIIRIKRSIVAMVSRPPYPIPEQVAAMRWELVQLVDAHITHEDLYVRQPLENSMDPFSRLLGKRYARTMIDFRLGTTAHCGRWTMAMVCSDWAGYHRASIDQLGLIEAQIAWEEEVVFPAADKIHRASRRDAA